MTLENLILNEMKHIDLNGIVVTSVAYINERLHIVFEIAPAKVEFYMSDDFEIQILKVHYQNNEYTEASYLKKFEHMAFDVVSKVKFVEMKVKLQNPLITPRTKQIKPIISKAIEQTRLDDIIKREEKIRVFEKELDIKEEKLKQFETTLVEKENQIAHQRKAAVDQLASKRLENQEKIENKFKTIFRFFLKK